MAWGWGCYLEGGVSHLFDASRFKSLFVCSSRGFFLFEVTRYSLVLNFVRLLGLLRYYVRFWA